VVAKSHVSTPVSTPMLDGDQSAAKNAAAATAVAAAVAAAIRSASARIGLAWLLRRVPAGRRALPCRRPLPRRPAPARHVLL